MKKLLFLCLMAISFCAKAQYVTIPDSNFRNALIALYPSCFNGSQQMDTTCYGIVSETSLNVAAKNIFNLDGVQYFDSLDYLNCYLNNLATLPNLPNKLKYLNCEHNQLLSLPTLPSGLTDLNCNENLITNISNLPNSLLYFSCSFNQISNLPNLPHGLINLICYENQLSSLPTLPLGLLVLSCNNNQISSLPTLPTGLVNLYCSFNILTSLPALPSSITSFLCLNNQIPILPTLPNVLVEFNCSSNQLTSLPTLPSSLAIFNCSYNQLTSLPTLPISLTHLYCNNNQITSLPTLPIGLTTLKCHNNPFLSCLPILPSGLNTFYISNTSINCLPNAPIGITTTLPICPVSSSCEPNPTASGLIFHDINANGIYDLGIDSTLKSLVVANTNGWSAVSMQNGEYIIKLDSGVVNTLTLSALTPYVQTINPILIQITPTSSGSQGSSYNFAVQLIPNIQDLRVDIATGIARPGFNQWCTTTVNNVGTLNVNNATLKVLKPTTFTFLNANPAISQQVGDTLIWNNINIGVLQQSGFDINWNIPANSVLGVTYQIQAWVEPFSTDSTPANNHIVFDGVFQGSYDPNDKSVNSEFIEPSMLNNELKYTIRFQNTGTDTAFTVIIRDTLSNNLDMSTFRILGASHNYSFIVRDHSLLEVFFQNILLPDSFTNEPKSHGFVQYSVKPKATLAVGDKIDNTAYIFFDFNSPVVTNTTTTQIVKTSIDEKYSLDADIYPNPNNGKVRVALTAKNSLPSSIGDGEQILLTISDLSGRVLMNLEVKDGQEVDLTVLSTGMYLAKIETKLGSKRMKLVKE